MTSLVNLDSIAQAQVARIAASLIVGSGVAFAGALALRLASRISAGVRYWLALLLMFSVALIVLRPVASEVSSTEISFIPALHLAAAWARYIFFAWAAIAFVGLLRVASGILAVHRLKSGSRRLDQSDLPAAQLLSKAHRFGQPISLYSSAHIQVPAAVGFLRPAVVIPEWMIGSPELSADDLDALVLHELAHLARWDDWANLIQKIVKALLFFHPAVWWLDSRIAAEREMACDDAVLRATRDARAYARCLARVAEQTYVRRTLALAQAAVGRLRLTSARVKRLLAGPAENAHGWKPAVAVSLFATVAIAGAFCRTPELISFNSPTIARTNSSLVDAQLPKSDLVLAAVSLKPRSPAARPQAVRTKILSDHDSTSRPVKATLPAATSPRLHLAAARTVSYSGSTPSFVVLIEKRQEIRGMDSGVGSIQIETWRVFLISDAPSAHRAIPNKEI